jgi:hypothetical protein
MGLGQFGHLAGDGGLQMLTEAAETPVGVRHFADEANFNEFLRPEMFGEFRQEGFIFRRVVAGEQDDLGAETVAEIIPGGGGFTFLGNGAVDD